MEEIEELRCKKCNEVLEHYDTIDHNGGIDEGYLVERQIWGCKKCNTDYMIEKRAEIKESDIDIIYFEESC